MDTELTGHLLRGLTEESVVHVGLPGSLFTQNFGLLTPSELGKNCMAVLPRIQYLATRLDPIISIVKTE
jgi:hypothetical protein